MKILISFILLTFLSLSMASAAITRIPVDVTYNNATDLLTISGENLFFTKVMNEAFVTQLYVIQTTEGDIVNLQLALANMTNMCNDSLGYVNKYVACELRNRYLEDYFNQVNNTKDLLANCTDSLSKCETDLSYWVSNGITRTTCDSEVKKQKSSDESNKWLYLVIAFVAGIAAFYGFTKWKGKANRPEGLNSFPRGS